MTNYEKCKRILDICENNYNSLLQEFEELSDKYRKLHNKYVKLRKKMSHNIYYV